MHSMFIQGLFEDFLFQSPYENYWMRPSDGSKSFENSNIAEFKHTVRPRLSDSKYGIRKLSDYQGCQHGRARIFQGEHCFKKIFKKFSKNFAKNIQKILKNFAKKISKNLQK